MSELETPPSFLTPPEQAPKAPASGFWLFYLFFRPKRFFSHFDHLVTRFTLVYATWMIGMAQVIDRFSTEAMKQQFSGRSSPTVELMNSWPVYWAVVLFSGAIGGILLYAIGGWWYRVRIGFSGAVEPDKSLARRTYIFASLVYAFPAVALAAVSSFSYPTPLATEEADSWWGSVVIACLFWSVLCSYRGVRTLFAVSTWRARLWFLVLPSLVYGIVIMGMYAVVLFLFFSAPNVEHPAKLKRPAFSLSYPGNWFVDDADEDYDPDHYFLIEGFQDAGILFMIEHEPSDPAERNDVILGSYLEIFVGSEPSVFDRWGRHSGIGAEYEGLLEGNNYRIRVFSMNTSSHGMTVLEFAEVGVARKAEPAFELIRSTFRLQD